MSKKNRYLEIAAMLAVIAVALGILLFVFESKKELCREILPNDVEKCIIVM